MAARRGLAPTHKVRNAYTYMLLCGTHSIDAVSKISKLFGILSPTKCTSFICNSCFVQLYSEISLHLASQKNNIQGRPVFHIWSSSLRLKFKLKIVSISYIFISLGCCTASVPPSVCSDLVYIQILSCLITY